MRLPNIFSKNPRQLSNKESSKNKNKFLREKELMNSGSQSYFYSPRKPVWSERSYEEFAKEAYAKNVIAHRAIHMIAQAASSVPMKLYKIINNEKHIVIDHPILKILQTPNPILSGKEFFESIYVYRLLSGNVYIIGFRLNDSDHNNDSNCEDGSLGSNSTDGKIHRNDLELYALRPDRVQVIAGDNFMPFGYRYSIDDRYIDYPVDLATGKSQILHIKNFNPLSDWYGLSSIEAAAYSIDQHNQASAWNQALLQNGARPSGAIIVKNAEGKPYGLSESERSNLRLSIEETFSGPNNSGRPLLLEGGLEWREMSLSPKDMDYIESKNNAAREIALALGVPPQILAIPGDNTYSNLIEARLALWEQTIVPLVDSTVNSLNRWLSQYFDEDFILTYDLDGVGALAERMDTIWSRVQNSNFMTINEQRRAVGLSPLEDSKYDKIIDKNQKD